MTVLAPSAAHAATGTLNVTTPASGKLAAGTSKQVVILTVSGTGATPLSEDNVVSVDLGATCTGLTGYVVTSPTTLSVKTPSSPVGCPAAGAENVSINFSDNTSLTKTGGITFVPPPAVETLSNKPIVAENSAGQITAQQNQRFWSTGGQVVRVKADPAFAFDPRTTAGLKANLGGKDGTEIKVYANTAASGLAQHDQMTAGATTEAQVVAQVGNYMTFKTAAAMDPTNDVLILTQNGVSKSFLKTATGAEVATGEMVTSVAPESGKSSGGTTIVITGTGFSKTNADYGTNVNVTVCGVNATFPATAVNSAGTQITAIVPTVSNASPGLGSTVYGGVCPVRIVNTPNTWTSPVTPGSFFVALNE
jgi:hypothetical protein